MKERMVTSHEESNYYGSREHPKSAYVNVILAVIMVILPLPCTARTLEEPERIEMVSREFFDIWLIKRDVDAALSFIDEHPVMPTCLADKRRGTTWWTTRKRVVHELRPAFERIARDSKGKTKLEDIIASQTAKLVYPRVSHDNADLFDIYPVNTELLNVILNNICRGEDRTNFFQTGITKRPELYLILFHFKAGLKVTSLWARNGDKLRIISLDFPDE